MGRANLRRLLVPVYLRNRSAESAFAPDTLEGLQLWLDANDLSTLFQDSALTTPVTADSQQVGGWVDKVTGTAKATQGTATRYPLYKTGVLNGLPGVLFDGSNDYMIPPNPELDGELTVVAVLNTVGLSAAGIPFIFSRNTGNTYYFWFTITNTPTVAVSVFDTAERAVSAAASDMTGGNIIGLTNVEGSPVSLWRNGVEQVGVVNTGTFGAQGASRLGIWRDTSTLPYNGHICELLIYDRVLSDSEMAQLSEFLGDKWGIPAVRSSLGNPLGIEDCLFWLDVSKLPAVEDLPVYVLPDLSGSSRHAIQPTLTLQGLMKTNIQNGLQAVLMDATDDYYKLVNQTIAITSELSLFGVFKIVDHAPAADPMLIAFSNVDASQPWIFELFYSVPDEDDRMYAVTYDTSSSVSAVIEETPIGAHIFGATMQEEAEITGYLDDHTKSEDVDTVFGKGAYSTTNAKIGANIDGLSRWMNGYICEVMAFDRKLTATEVGRVIAYLSNKWGIVS